MHTSLLYFWKARHDLCLLFDSPLAAHPNKHLYRHSWRVTATPGNPHSRIHHFGHESAKEANLLLFHYKPYALKQACFARH